MEVDETDDNNNTSSNVELFTSTVWQKTLSTIVKAVVAIKFCTTRHFDTERSGYSVATGYESSIFFKY